ncbi:hypothetical protein ACHAWU_001813 [Discostella pseudostelligera]|uniref:Uncharacterized protein n=1 Tax=Discostella pseudostelligera TaxID=259834 RepID=A0ABD3MEI6_9STRA
MSHHYLRPAPKRSNAPVPHTAYQVDYAAKNCGRMVPASKRLIRFKFGYTNAEALASGKTGQDCRGSEHEVLITWSLSSGKQAIAFDQQEVYFDVGDTTQSKISHSWKDKNGRTLAVKVHAANMSTKNEPDPYWKQYDLFIDGVSFFRMPKIFELGTFSKEVTMGSSPFNHRVASDMEFSLPPKSKEGENAEVIKEHAPEPEPEPEPPAVVDLLSFDDFDTPAPVVQQEVPAQFNSGYALTQTPAQPAYNNYALPQAQTHANNYTGAQVLPTPAPAQYQHSYAPNAYQYQAQTSPFENAPVQSSPFAAPSNPFESSQIQNGPSTFAAPVNPFESSTTQNGTPTQGFGTTGYQSSYYQSSANDTSYATPTSTETYQPQPNFVTPPSSSNALDQPPSTSTANGIDAAVNKLVNFDNIMSFASPASNANISGANAHMSIGHLQGNQNSNQKKCVINPFDAAPVHQQQQQQQQQQVFNKFATQQPLYNNYAQQGYVQQGFGYQ